MPVPKRRTSKSKKNQRRSHDALTPPQLARCAKCGEAVFPHRACPSCGFYRGRQAIAVKEG